MPVNSSHPEHQAAAPDWQLMRDVARGERAVKAAGDLYVPRLTEQTHADFLAYVKRGVFFNATARTMEGHHGLIFRKDYNLEADGTLAAFLQDATLEGHTFYDYAKDTVREVLEVGRRGTLVDWNMGPENRPYLVAYTAEQILNWKMERVRGQMVLTMLVLEEWSTEHRPEVDGPADPDEFAAQAWPQWRVYRLEPDPDGQEPFVTCTVYRQRAERQAPKVKTPRGQPSAATGRDRNAPKPILGSPGDTDFAIVEGPTVPTRRGIPLARIPFVFHGPVNSQPAVPKIPLLDLALVNLAHFRNSVDLERGRHRCAEPTPWVTGYKPPEGEKLRLGSDYAWTIEEKDAAVGFLEFTGAGLGAIKEGMAEKESQMAALGARMLEPEAKKAEAFDTVAMRSTGETSALSQLAIAVGESLSQVLRWAAWWTGTATRPEDLTETTKVELNTDYLTSRMDPVMLQALSASYLGGTLPVESYVAALQKGELVDPEMTVEQFMASIKENPPGLPMPEPAPGPAVE